MIKFNDTNFYNNDFFEIRLSYSSFSSFLLERKCHSKADSIICMNKIDLTIDK